MPIPNLENEQPPVKKTGGIPVLDGPAPADPNRDPIPGHSYDLSFAQPAFRAVLGDYSGVAGRAAGIDVDQTVQGRLADYQIGVLGKLFYWMDRPYTAVMSTVDAMMRGQNIAKEAAKGFTGNREAGFINVLENTGMDPNQLSTQLLGVGLDVVAGSFLDPTNYVSFGAKGPLKGLAKAGKILSSVDNIDALVKGGRISESLGKQLVGIETLGKRSELAQRGLWGLNWKIPYVPFVGKAIDAATGSTQLGKRLVREGVVVTPTYLNVQAAKSMDAIGNWLAPVNDGLRKVFGGERYWLERSGIADMQEWASTNKTRYQADQFYHAQQMFELAQSVPIETRRSKSAMVAFLEKQFHALEDPDLIDSVATHMSNRVRKLTPDELAAAAQKRMMLAKAETDVMDEFNRGMQAEMSGLRASVDDWMEARKRLTSVSLEDLTAFMGREQGRENLGKYADEIWNDLARFEGDVTAYLQWKGEIPDVEQLGGMLPEGARFKAVLSGAPVGPDALKRGQKQFAKIKGEEFDMGTEFAHQFTNPYFVVELPQVSTLSGEFKNLGGIEGFTRLELRKERVTSIADRLDEFSRQGGNSYELVSNFMKSIDDELDDTARFAARKKYSNLARKAGLSPDNKSTQQILEAVYWRRVANSHVPGYYSANAERMAEDLISGEIFSDDPVARFMAQHETLRKELDTLNGKLARAEAGDIPKAEYVPPDYLSQEELADMGARLDLKSQMRERIAAIDNEIADIHSRFEVDPDAIQAQKDRLYDLTAERSAAILQMDDATNPPIREVEARYKMELIAQRDAVKRALENPDPIDRAIFTRDMIAKQLKRNKKPPALVKEAVETEALHFSPEEQEFYDRLKPIRDEAVSRIEQRYKQYDPEFKMKYEHYLPHFWASAPRLLERIKDARTVKKWKNIRLQELQSVHPTRSIDELKAIAQREANEKFGIRDVRLTREEAKGNYDFQKQRKYDATVREMKASDFPINWNTDAVRAVNAMYTNAQKWEFHVDMVEELQRRGLAKQFFPGTNPDDMARHLGGKAVPLQAEGLFNMMRDQSNNPFINLWVSEDVKKFYDRTLMGSSAVMFGDGFMQKALDVVNAVRKWGAMWTLLPFPAFYFRNVPSDVIRAAMNGMDIDILNPRTRKNMQLAAQFAWQRSDNIASYLPPPARQGVLPHRVDDEIAELRKLFGPSADGLTVEWLNRYLHANVMDFHLRDVERYGEEERPIVLAERNKVQKTIDFIKGLPNPDPMKNTWIQMMQSKLGNPTQNLTRVWAWFDAVHKYADTGLVTMDQAFKAATDSVRQSQFDYGDLTLVEQNIFKNVNWFYTYISKSLPFHFKKLMMEPGKIAPYYRAYMGFWNNFENDFEPEDTREFITEQLGVPIKRGVDPETGETRMQMWSPTNWVGIADLNEAADWARSIITKDKEGFYQAVGMNINPILKAAAEHFFQVDFLTGQEIEQNEYTDVFGIPMSVPTARLIRNFRLVNEIDRLNPGGAWTALAKWNGAITDERAHRNEAPEPSRWMQSLFGFRMFEANPVKDVERNLRDQLKDFEDYKRTARNAARDGNQKEMRENLEAIMEMMPEALATKARLEHWKEQTRIQKELTAIGIANK